VNNNNQVIDEIHAVTIPWKSLTPTRARTGLIVGPKFGLNLLVPSKR
jgi:hypothetical protein